MKKIYLLSALVLTAIFFSSCKENVKNEANPIEKTYSADAKTTAINWTAYKTTAKLPVKGQFTEVTIENAPKGASAVEALNGLKFSIPISSLFTKDTIRDGKLKKFFFGTLKNTELISGSIAMLTDSTGTVNLTMNGISKPLPISCGIVDQKVTIEALMDLNDWEAQPALDALNVVCNEMHTGPDGISKTWSEVKIEVIADLKFE